MSARTPVDDRRSMKKPARDSARIGDAPFFPAWLTLAKSKHTGEVGPSRRPIFDYLEHSGPCFERGDHIIVRRAQHRTFDRQLLSKCRHRLAIIPSVRQSIKIVCDPVAFGQEASSLRVVGLRWGGTSYRGSLSQR